MSLLDWISPEAASTLEDVRKKRLLNNELSNQMDSQARLLGTPDTQGNSIMAQPMVPILPQSLQQFQPFQDGASSPMPPPYQGPGQGSAPPPMQGPTQSAGMDGPQLLGYAQQRRGLLDDAFPQARLAQMQAQAFPAPPVFKEIQPGSTGGMLGADGKFTPSYTAPMKPNLPVGADATGAPLPGMKSYWQTEADAKKDPLKDQLTQSEIDKNKHQISQGDGNLLTGDTLDMSADQLLAGDPSPMQGLGYGNIGATNRAALRNKVAEKAKAAGMSGADLAAVNAEYFGTKAGERTLGTRSANIDMAVNEAANMSPILREASAAVPRGQWQTPNKWLNAYRTQTGDVATRQLGASLNSYLNAYATAVGKGTMTVEGRRHAEDMLSGADSQEVMTGVMDILDKEMQAALAAPGQTRAGLRAAVTGQNAPPAQAAPSTVPGAATKITNDAAGQAAYSQLQPGSQYIDPTGVTRTKK